MATRVTIIGAGPGGYVAAIRAAQMGARVTVIEEAEVGGTCLHWGCIPTKTIISSAEALVRAKHAEAYGLQISGEISYSLEKIRERKDKVVATQVKGIRSLFKSWGISLLQARGSLLSSDVVRAVQPDGTTLDVKSDRIIIATGSRPARLPGFPTDVRIMTSDDAIQLRSVPKHLLIVGAGVIGCEFAFIYHTLGSEVTMVEMLPRALSTEDEAISGVIERELKKAKIKLLTSVKVESVQQGPEQLTAVLSDGTSVSIDQMLVSIGRSMNTEGLGLEMADVEAGQRGEIIVNDRMETNVPGVYAIGDVTGKLMLAHVASHQGLVAVENALGGSERMEYGAVPSGIFTMPEAGSVGLREHEASERNIPVTTGIFHYRGLGKAHAMGEITGLVKVIADKKTDRVLGVHICGAHASDLVHEGALAISMGATARQLSQMIHAHPTLAEAIMEAAGDVQGRAIHVPKTSS